eukprot:scaffold434_cov358-Prasinococcus_capsulatus_cf.AAC.7
MRSSRVCDVLVAIAFDRNVLPLLLLYDATIDEETTSSNGEGVITLEERRSKPQLAQNFHAMQGVRLLVRLAGCQGGAPGTKHAAVAAQALNAMLTPGMAIDLTRL